MINLLTYLFNNFNFKSKIIHSDFEKSLNYEIKNNINIKSDIIHIKMPFLFFTKGI